MTMAFELIRPGIILKEDFMDELRLDSQELASKIGDVMPEDIENIINGKLKITSSMSKKLAKVTETSVNFWANLQKNYDESINRTDRKGEFDLLPCLAAQDLRNCKLPKNLMNANLSGATLTGMDLRRKNLRKANLSNANLSNVILSNVDLREANLEGANLREANLEGANLLEAHLVGADFSKSNLQLAKLKLANLEKANLTGADLRCANLSFADFHHANFTRVKLDNAYGSAKLKDFSLDLVEIEDFKKWAEAAAIAQAFTIESEG